MEPMVTAEISADAIRRNILAIRRRLGSAAVLCPAVKADAYGHGLLGVLPVLLEAGIDRLAVAHLAEALEARRLGWDRALLCLAPVLAGCDESESRERAEAAVQAGISLTVMSLSEAQILKAAAERLSVTALVEVKVDTGMGRMGLIPEQAEQLVRDIAGLGPLAIEGVYTHFASADEPSLDSSREQLDRFIVLRDRLRRADLPIRHFHAANSAAIFRFPESHLDRVRPGLALYGYWGGPEGERPADLTPAMRVVSRLVAVRRIPSDCTVGYGRTFRTRRDSVIGIVPIGYADGYRRSLGNAAVMLLEAVRGLPRRAVAVVGRISMDQTTVDLTDAGEVRVGDRITVIDSDPSAPNSVETLARKLHTIPYEITCLVGTRVRRVLSRGCA
ncbi:MAG TPA: alanine racemase [Phycisphaerae bacterium]|nr:alanine racemase [Phycisphaerae bacterium]HRY71000.1 alanine racemase [Phycisphaerae bacterium]HSA29292.1 alanine racemase [Phycisphaerae bacterium]